MLPPLIFKSVNKAVFVVVVVVVVIYVCLGSLSSLTVPTANDTAFCGSEHTLPSAPEKQGKRISWKVSA